MPEKSSSRNVSFITSVRNNPWMVSTFVLGILFLVALFVASSGGLGTGATVSEQEIGQKVLAALNKQTGGGVTLGPVAREGGLYKVTVTYQGDEVPVYATLDGTKLAFQVLSLDGSDTAPIPTPSQPSAPTSVTIDADKIKNAPVMGSASAPVTIVEFSDYQCPFCERFFSDAMPQLEEQYVKTGKVRIVFMDFPLSFHDQAQKASEAARCFRKAKGGSSVSYYQYHDKLFANQALLGVDNFKKWAAELGAQSSMFDNCLDSGEFSAAVQADQTYGASLGVSGTPSFFINGVAVVGAQPFSAFKQVIDAQLAK